MRLFFLDTNLFLQCRAIDELPWNEVADGQDLKLLIPRAVQKEIDRLKADGNSRRARRARKASELFREIVLSANETLAIHYVAPRVEVSFPESARTHVPSPESLDLTRIDDQIVWEMLGHAVENPGDPILLTHDTNLLLTAKRHGLPVLPIPDAWLLPPEPDERDKRIADLERRLTQREQTAPRIVLPATCGYRPIMITRITSS